MEWNLGAAVAVGWDPAGNDVLRAEAERVAAEAGLPLAARGEGGWRMPASGDEPEMLLVLTATRLELRVLHTAPAPGNPAPGSGSENASEPGLAGGLPVAVDLLKVDATTGQGRSLRQPLARAVGLRKGEAWRPSVVDATAGFGEDAWLLASLGCEVTAVERNPVMAALLADGLRRAAERQPDVAARLRVVRGDGAAVLRALAPRPRTSAEEATDAAARAAAPSVPPAQRTNILENVGTSPPPDTGAGVGAEAGVGGGRPEVVYLDPMFPAAAGGRRRKSLERKPMRVLRRLAGDDPDAAALLDVALSAATRRVVVKRPSGAPALGGREPVATHAGQAVRYDVYVPAPAD